MIWLLLVIYQIKHFVADYLLQGKYMLGKFKPYPYFILPLLAHSLVHGVITFLIAICFKGLGFSLFLAGFDMGIHFLVDRIKASPEMLGKYKSISMKEYVALWRDFPAQALSIEKDQVKLLEIDNQERKSVMRSNKIFWWSVGADQFAHHLTHYAIIWMLL